MPRNPYYSGPISDHFDGMRFLMPGGEPDKNLGELFKMLWNARTQRAPWPPRLTTLHCPKPPERVMGENIRATFIGHSSFLLQTQGVNLLLDPVWADRAGPYGLLGPRRVMAPALRIEDLPPLDAILLSHNHYDHMDLATLSKLAGARHCPVITPLGNDTILKRANPRIDARAHDWGDIVDIGPLRIHLEPAHHWSARTRGDRRMALWASFIIEGAGKIYFAGDTGFGDGKLFDDLFQRHGPMRFALLPIGAYEPRWFMKAQHVDPDEAVAIFKAMRIEQAFACHWGTFRLTDEPHEDPPRRLAEALAREGIAPERFVAAPPGHVVEIG